MGSLWNLLVFSFSWATSSLGDLVGFYSESTETIWEFPMKYLITLLLIAQAVLLVRGASAQAIYGPTGEYRGYSQTSPSGVTNVYNATG